jgi:hypothetical protein
MQSQILWSLPFISLAEIAASSVPIVRVKVRISLSDDSTSAYIPVAAERANMEVILDMSQDAEVEPRT